MRNRMKTKHNKNRAGCASTLYPDLKVCDCHQPESNTHDLVNELQAHMPTPWKYEWDQVQGSWRILYHTKNGIWHSSPYHFRSEADAAFIVNSVNSCAELLEAAKAALRIWPEEPETLILYDYQIKENEVLERLEKAIHQAEGNNEK